MIIDPEAHAFIESQRVARLATVDERGRPHVVPICFALEGDTLYTPIDEKPKSGDYTRLRRLRSIAVNPHVQVLFDLYEDADWSRLRYVQLRGTARVIDTGGEHVRALTRLRARYAQYCTSCGGPGDDALDIDRDDGATFELHADVLGVAGT